MRPFAGILPILFILAATAVAQEPESRPESRPSSRPVGGDGPGLDGAEATSRPRGGRRPRPMGRAGSDTRPDTRPDSRAESRPESKPADSPYLAFVNGTIYPIGGPVIRQGTLLVKNDKIIQLGRQVQIPDGARIVDATNKHVVPGFVAVRTSGTFGGGFGPRGDQEKLADQFDPYSISMLMTLAHGITTACEGGGGTAVGQVAGSIGKHTYGTVEGMSLREPAALFLQYNQGNMSERLQTREILQRAVEYRTKRNAYVAEVMAGKKDAKAPTGDENVKNFVRVMDGELPCLVNGATNAEIDGLVALSLDFDLPLVIVDPREAWSMTERLARAKISVILQPRNRGPAKEGGAEPRTFVERPSGWTITNAAAMERAGIPFATMALSGAVGTGGLPGRDLMQLNMDAAFTVRGGASEELALRSITLTAAEILKVQDRVGSFAPGKDADVVVFDLDPLDYRAFAEKVYVNGRIAYEKDKISFFNHIQTDRAKGLLGRWWNER